MFGFDPLTMATAGLLMNVAAGGCDMAQKPQINILPEAIKTRLVTARNLQELQNVEVDTVDPYGLHAQTLTQGFMQGRISVHPAIKMDFYQYPGQDRVCLWYKNIDVRIKIDPEIHVAQEVYRDNCMRRAVVEHENKHITVDRKLVNQLAQSVGNAVYAEIRRRGHVVGPLSVSEAEAMVPKMQSVVIDLVQQNYKAFQEARMHAQQAVDTYEEYERVRAQCPDFKMQAPVK